MGRGQETVPAHLHITCLLMPLALMYGMPFFVPSLPHSHRVQEHLQSMSSSRLYNVLHLHAEKQWVEQCARWERAEQGELGSCSAAHSLQACTWSRFPTGLPLVVRFVGRLLSCSAK